MRVISTAEGRRRIWYRADEIELICEAALVRSGLFPVVPRCDVDVESLIENHLGVVVDYGVDLPPDVLGFTDFGARPLIAINRHLTDAATASDASGSVVGRWRATIAHEAAHVLLHSPMFDHSPNYPGVPHQKPIRCPRRTFDAPMAKSDWREVQANMGMAALLMPRSVFDRETKTAFDRRGRLVPPVDTDTRWLESVVALLASRFSVSRQAARIRLGVLGYVDRP
jgi:hypothetical protein